MNVRNLVYTASAEEDFNDVLRYIVEQSRDIETALGFVERLRARCRRIASLPGTLGSARAELMADVRSVSEQGYVIFFRYLPEHVEIIHVLEGHRDVASQFDPPQSH